MHCASGGKSFTTGFRSGAGPRYFKGEGPVSVKSRFLSPKATTISWQIGVSHSHGDKGMSGQSPLKHKPLRLHRNPIEQATAAARWLEKILEESTGKRFFVRGVVVFPGWFVEQRGTRGDVWVLEPKALPAFIENAPAMIVPSDVKLAAFHLARYVRGSAGKAA